MNHILIESKQGKVQADLVRSLLVSAPLWASGLAFLTVLFSASEIADPHGLKFVALSLAVIGIATFAAFRMMTNEIERTQALHSAMCRLMQLRAKRQQSLRAVHRTSSAKTA